MLTPYGIGDKASPPRFLWTQLIGWQCKTPTGSYNTRHPVLLRLHMRDFQVPARSAVDKPPKTHVAASISPAFGR
jgi:hypothetical protein